MGERRATEGDRLAIFKMAAEMHRETIFSAYTFDPAKAIDRIGSWISGNGVMFVAERAGEVVGMLAASPKEVWFGPDVLVVEELFYVKPAHRGSFAAYRLMESFMAWAKSLGRCHVRAGVATRLDNAAGRLYQHFGLEFDGGNYSATMGE